MAPQTRESMSAPAAALVPLPLASARRCGGGEYLDRSASWCSDGHSGASEQHLRFRIDTWWPVTEHRTQLHRSPLRNGRRFQPQGGLAFCVNLLCREILALFERNLVCVKLYFR